MDKKQNITIYYIDNNDNEHNIPMNILTQILTHLQKTVYLIAMETENRIFNARARIPEEIETIYSLKCSVPFKSSYAIPAFIEPVNNTLFPEPQNEKIQKTVTFLENIIQSISNNDITKYMDVLKNKILRSRILDSIIKMLPAEGSNWKLKLKINESNENNLTSIHTSNIKHWRLLNREEDFQTVTGQLNAIDFKNRKIELLYPVTQKKLDCFYEEAVEELLLENRRDWIQVTGIVEVNYDGEIMRIKEVNDITDLDLSEFTFSKIPIDENHILKFKKPLILRPVQDEESFQYLIVENYDLNIYVYETSRTKLYQSVCEQIIVNWEEYAREDDSKLSPKAKEVKDNLHARIQEVYNERQEGS